MKSILSSSAVTAVVLSGLLLSACGGGGGSDDSGATNTDKPTSPPVVTPPVVEPVEPPVVTPPVVEPVEPPVVTPPASSDEMVSMAAIGSKNHEEAGLAGSNEISLQRQTCGLGGVSYDAELTTIATKHAQYLAHVAKNKTAYGLPAHSEAEYMNYEDVTGNSNPFFTGVSFTDRITAANYKNLTYMAGENISESVLYNPAGMSPTPSSRAQQLVKGLFAAPYHMQTLLSPSYTQTGSGFVTYVPFGKQAKEHLGYKFVNASAGSKTQSGASIEGVFTYPCDGVTDTVTALYNESPSPVAGTGRNLATDPIGQPIYVYVPTATEIKVSNVKIRDTKRNITVPADLLDFDNDPHKKTSAELPKNKAFILPITDDLVSCPNDYRKNCGLGEFTEYQVTFDVLADNKTMYKKDFTFKTGAFN